MAGVVRARLAELGLTLPEPLVAPPGVLLPFELVRVSGDRAYISGHGPIARLEVQLALTFAGFQNALTGAPSDPLCVPADDLGGLIISGPDDEFSHTRQ